ncbi:Golgin subfamily A member 4 [Hibiscus syriacus]|uniref:Golgin subfamily A member 4 n=1 Tax=Hibiscus syriacus TaxID=106335 RepID=A0A6A3C5J3_HIBSY|nr:Golgin subfamily A member 4 [Hibiscus syriacus]
MDIKVWHRQSSSRTEQIKLGRSCTQRGRDEDRSRPKWRTFWKKFTRRKKIFTSPVGLQASYDPDEYSQNFDQGTGWAEPDNLSRSFSARFADPSRISRRNALRSCE